MISDHTIGSHSDDRGGDNDFPCYCDSKPKPMSQQSELDVQGFLENLCRGNYDEDGLCIWDLAELRDATEALLNKRIAESVLKELEFIADKDFVYKDYKGDDCISLDRINGRIERQRKRLGDIQL